MEQELPDAAADQGGRPAGGPGRGPESPARAPLAEVIEARVTRFLRGEDPDHGSDDEAPLPAPPQLPEHARRVPSQANKSGFTFTCTLCAPSGKAAVLNGGSQVQEHVKGKRRNKRFGRLKAGALQLSERALRLTLV